MNATQLALFLGKYLGPTFERQKLWPRTLLSYGGQAERWSAADVVPIVLADPDAARYPRSAPNSRFSGRRRLRGPPPRRPSSPPREIVPARYMGVIAYHGYDCQYEDDGSCTDERQNYDAIAGLHAAYPGHWLWMTEICPRRPRPKRERARRPAASPRLVSAEYPRRGRGVAATRLRRISAS